MSANVILDENLRKVFDVTCTNQFKSISGQYKKVATIISRRKE